MSSTYLRQRDMWGRIGQPPEFGKWMEKRGPVDGFEYFPDVGNEVGR